MIKNYNEYAEMRLLGWRVLKTLYVRHVRKVRCVFDIERYERCALLGKKRVLSQTRTTGCSRIRKMNQKKTKTDIFKCKHVLYHMQNICGKEISCSNC